MPIQLKQINILCHEKKIPSQIEFLSYIPKTQNEFFLNYKTIKFNNIGFIRLDTNSKTNYQAREFKRVYMNNNVLYLKMVFHKNYINKFNIFNQVGMISISFYGEISNISQQITNNIQEELQPIDDQCDDLALMKIKLLKKIQDDYAKNDRFEEAKNIKSYLEKVKLIGRKLFELDYSKKQYIAEEDFDAAKIIKLEIDNLRSLIKNIDKQLSPITPEMATKTNDNQSLHEEIPESLK